MPSKNEKARRNAIKKALAAKELTELRESMPLSPGDLDALLTSVDEGVRSDVCDHTLRHARAFMEQRGLDADHIVPWLNDQGGFCDCEVFARYDGGVDVFLASRARRDGLKPQFVDWLSRREDGL